MFKLHFLINNKKGIENILNLCLVWPIIYLLQETNINNATVIFALKLSCILSL